MTIQNELIKGQSAVLFLQLTCKTQQFLMETESGHF